MKIICTQENLKAGLASAARVVSNSNTLPILNNLLLKTENGFLKIYATNLEIAIISTVRCKIEKEGALCLPAKIFSELVSAIPNQNISIEGEKGTAKIHTQNYNASIKTLPSDEFPLIPQVEKNLSLKLKGQTLKTAIDQVVFAASTSETQPEISGVLLKLEGKKIKLVATDRYRLAERILESEGNQPNKQVIFPQRTAAETSRLIGFSEETVEITLGDNQMAVNLNGSQVISRLIDGQYPDYEQIIPPSFQGVITADRQSLVNALKTSSIFSRSSNSVRVYFSQEEQRLVVASGPQELGESQVEIEGAVEGPSGSVMFNYKYLLDALSMLTDEKVVINVVNDSSPVIFTPSGRQDYRYLVMPIKS